MKPTTKASIKYGLIMMLPTLIAVIFYPIWLISIWTAEGYRIIRKWAIKKVYNVKVDEG
jgi:hypothetical protein